MQGFLFNHRGARVSHLTYRQGEPVQEEVTRELSSPAYSTLTIKKGDQHMARAALIRRSGIMALMFTVASLFLVLSPATTWAEKEPHGPCAADVEKFCKDVKPGEGRILNCLKEHEKDLSPACKEKDSEMKQMLGDFRKACEGDVQKLCKDVQPGEGRIIKCLKEHEKELSPNCSATMEKGKEMRKGK